MSAIIRFINVREPNGYVAPHGSKGNGDKTIWVISMEDGYRFMGRIFPPSWKSKRLKRGDNKLNINQKL